MSAVESARITATRENAEGGDRRVDAVLGRAPEPRRQCDEAQQLQSVSAVGEGSESSRSEAGGGAAAVRNSEEPQVA